MSIFQSKLALVIDDDVKSIKVMQQLLEYVEVESIAIPDSYRLEELLQGVAVPDVIFLDLEMPRSNGYSVLEFLQGDSRFKEVPVVAYTTHISHLNDARDAGFHSFLGKPVDGDLFPENLAKILQGVPVWEVPS